MKNMILCSCFFLTSVRNSLTNSSRQLAATSCSLRALNITCSVYVCVTSVWCFCVKIIRLLLVTQGECWFFTWFYAHFHFFHCCKQTQIFIHTYFMDSPFFNVQDTWYQAVRVFEWSWERWLHFPALKPDAEPHWSMLAAVAMCKTTSGSFLTDRRIPVT